MMVAVFVVHLAVGVVCYQTLLLIFDCSNPNLDACRKSLEAALKRLAWAGDILQKSY
jgi:hypothetical protein